MKIDVIMPKMGESIMEGTIVKWHKKVNDFIKVDEIIFEIETDKVDSEIPSPVEGILSEIIFGENETVEVGTIVARIESAGEEVPERENETEKEAESIIEVMQNSESVENTIIETDRFLSPLVRSIAERENISGKVLDRIKGTGLKGRLTKNDLLNFINEQKDIKDVSKTGTNSIPSGVTEIIPMDKLRKKISKHMLNSRDTSVHVTGVTEVDVTNIAEYIKKNKDRILKGENVKLTYLPFISAAVIKSLKQYPLINASLDGDNIIQKKYINLGFAVAVEPNGLIVPNIKNADEKSVKGLAKEIIKLSDSARTNNLKPDDISNGTFTLTNYGVFGTLIGTPIINQPEVAILGIGAVVKKPVVLEADGSDTIAIRSMMYISISHDHRLVDGMMGSKFLKSVKDTLEDFDLSFI
ncbi:MAG: 2-oxo acid dehydrogenase subunit E2 [Melioribacteraceae bacterium]|nr:2-oxo acid dehydrogenase subunit E2 [Melioribacteraceae bacterium]